MKIIKLTNWDNGETVWLNSAYIVKVDVQPPQRAVIHYLAPEARAVSVKESPLQVAK